MNLMKALGINVDIKISSSKAQLLIAAALFILAVGIAWSFIQGYSTIKFRKELHGSKPQESLETQKPVIDKK